MVRVHKNLKGSITFNKTLVTTADKRENSDSPEGEKTSFYTQVRFTNISCLKEDNSSVNSCYLRISPRKHASTLSVLQQTNENISPKISPHKIEINFDVIDSETNEIIYSDQRVPIVNGTPHLAKKQTKSGRNKASREVKSTSDKRKKDNNHKLTEFFPVRRRSERKTKKVVQEELQKSLELAVLSMKEDGLDIKIFPSKGRGIVTTRKFEKGDFVVEYAGDLITIDEAREREQIYSEDQNTGCYMYYFTFRNNQYCVDATSESTRLGRLVNHSRNGNLVTKVVPVDDKPHLVLIAKHTIAPGEEITYDYGDRRKESLEHHPWLAF